jgi:hypothetical protein
VAASLSPAAGGRVGDDLISAAVPANTRGVETSAWKSWCAFREGRGEPHRVDDAMPQRDFEDLCCAFYLTVYGGMRARRKADGLPKPQSAMQVVCAMRRLHARLYGELKPAPRVGRLCEALATRVAATVGTNALLPSRKAPLTLESILNANAKAEADGLVVDGRVVDWSSPFFMCYRAASLTLFYAGARKSDVLVTAGTPHDRRRPSAADLTFHAPGAALPPRLAAPSVAELTPRADGVVRVFLRGTKADQTCVVNADYALLLDGADDGDPANGAEALRAYAAACPRLADVPLVDQPLFAVDGVAFSGELFDKVTKAILANLLGEAAADYSSHSFRIGAATALRDAGYSDAEIMRAFRWKSMPVMDGYARVGDEARLDTARSLRKRGSDAAEGDGGPAAAVASGSTPSRRTRVLGLAAGDAVGLASGAGQRRRRAVAIAAGSTAVASLAATGVAVPSAMAAPVAAPALAVPAPSRRRRGAARADTTAPA